MSDTDRDVVVPYSHFLAAVERRRPIVERPQAPTPETRADVPPAPDETHPPLTTARRPS